MLVYSEYSLEVGSAYSVLKGPVVQIVKYDRTTLRLDKIVSFEYNLGKLKCFEPFQKL